MNRKRCLFVLLTIFSIMLIPSVVFADMGPKPSIEVKIENLDTTDYMIDLFVYDSSGEGYKAKFNYNGDELTTAQAKKLYQLNFDGWISESTRWGYYLLFSDCKGNNTHTHTFSYFGTPDIYKVVIINNKTNEVKITDAIIRDSFNSSITIDYITMTKTDKYNYMKTIIIAAACLLVTVLVELLMAKLLKVGNYKTIALTNVATNLAYQTALFLFLNNYLWTSLIGELFVILIELIVYLLKFKNVSKIRTIIYCICANVETILISELLYVYLIIQILNNF